MPRNDEVEIIERPFVSRIGQMPITRVIDMENALSVDLLHRPDEASEGAALAAFTKACHSSRVPDSTDLNMMQAPLEDVVAGAALWQSQEILHWTFIVRNCTRMLTHQLVRARVGITFSQQCFGDHDARHADILVPRCFNSRQRQAFIAHSIEAKMLYASMVDAGICIQEARYLLPHSVATFICVHASLNALADMYSKRVCTMTQPWETTEFAHKMKASIVESSPWAAPIFRSQCESKSCFFHRAKKVGHAITQLWAPDEIHDDFDWNPKSFEHGPLTHAQTSSGPDEVDVQHYVGEMPVSFLAYSKKEAEVFNE